jgi:hypothetical protein
MNHPEVICCCNQLTLIVSGKPNDKKLETIIVASVTLTLIVLLLLGIGIGVKLYLDKVNDSF